MSIGDVDFYPNGGVHQPNNSIFKRDRYAETLSIVKEAKLNTTKTPLQRYLLRKYDVLEVAGIDKLIRKGNYE